MTYRSRFDRSLLPVAFDFYRRELGALGRESSRGWAMARCGCPFHQTKTKRSFFVHHNGAFKCFGCETHGGDVVAYLQKRYNLSFIDAAKQVGAWREDLSLAESARLAKQRRDSARHREELEAQKVRERHARVDAGDSLRAVETLYREAITEHDWVLMSMTLPRLRQLGQSYYTMCQLGEFEI